MATDEFIVFYAWQSDSPKQQNRNFIESALETALNQLVRAGSAVSHYLKAFKSRGTEGPWYVAIGIANLKKSALYVGASFAFGGRVFEGGEIMPPIVEVPADADLEAPQSTARALRPAFDYVWREHNYPRSINYGETGDWVGH